MNRNLLALLVLILAGALVVILGPDRTGDVPPDPAQQGQGDAETPAAAAAKPQPDQEGEAPPAFFGGTNSGGRLNFGQGDSSAEGGDGVLEVQVWDSERQPIPGALVAAFPKQPFDELGVEAKRVRQEGRPCDRQGRRRLQNLNPGLSYRVAAIAPGYAVKRSPAVPVGGKVELTLVPSVTIRGEVRLANGDPVPEAAVLLSAQDMSLDGLPPVARSDSKGGFQLEAPGAGNYHLRVRSAFGSDQWLKDLAVFKDMEPVQIIVEGEAALVVALLNEQAQPLIGHRVQLASTGRGDGALGARTGLSDDQGEVTFYSLQQGMYELKVEVPGFAPLRERWIYRGEAERLERVLRQPGTLEVQVVDAGGNVVPDFPVFLHARDRQVRFGLPRNQRQRATDEEGQCRWTDLPPGDYLVTAGNPAGDQDGIQLEEALQSRENVGSGTVWAAVSAGTENRTQMVLEGFLVQRLWVRQNGDPVAGATVAVTLFRKVDLGKQMYFSMRQSNEQGEVRLPPLKPGNYTVLVRASDWALPHHSTIEVSANGEAAVVDLPSGFLYGQALHGGQAVAGASVKLVDADGRPLMDAFQMGGRFQGVTTMEDGNWVVESVPAGEYLVIIEAEDLYPWKSPPLQHDGVQGFPVGVTEMVAAASLEGLVKNLPSQDNGAAFQLLPLHLVDLAGNRMATTILDPQGRFQFPQLTPGDFRLMLEVGGSEHQSPPVRIQAGDNFFEFPLP